MRQVVVAVVLVACTKHEEQATSSVATSSSVAATATATGKPSTNVPAPTFDVQPIVPVPITACTVTFSCGLSHPGLGSSSRTTSVDLGKCERAYSSDSGPYDPTSPRNPPTKTITKLTKQACDRLSDLAGALGPADATAAMESAHMDSEACGLSIMCPGDSAERFHVQRQTTTGSTRVEQTIRAVLGAAP